MEYTKRDIQRRAIYIRTKYHAGQLSAKEVTQYESLSGWYWTVECMSFTEARTVARKQRLTSCSAFRAWKKPLGMPSHPDKNYKNLGWIDWYDFLGNKKGK